MLPSTTPPQHRLYSQVLFALETRALRYVTDVEKALSNGVSRRQINRLTNSVDKAVNQLPSIWSWTSDESVTAALIRHREDLLAAFYELAASLRLCMETEAAGGKLDMFKLERLKDIELELDELRASMALLSPIHLAAAEHFDAAVNEGSFFDMASNSTGNSARANAVLTEVYELYVKLDEAWRALFVAPSAVALENYIAVAQELHAEGSPLFSPDSGDLLAPSDESVAATEKLLDKLLAAALVYETIG